MKLFENKVGRPSNELLAKRSAFKLIIFSCILLVLIITTVFFSNYYGTSLKGDSSVTKITYDVKGNNGSFIVNGVHYQRGVYANFDTIGNNVLFGNYNGKTNLQIRARYPQSVYKPSRQNGELFPNYMYVKFIMYDKNNGILSKCNTKKITSSTYTCNFTISSNSHHIDVELYNTDMTRNTVGVRIGYKRIEIAKCAKVVIKPVSNLTKLSNGAYFVTKYDTFKNTATIYNDNERTLYYKWFTYDNINYSPSLVMHSGTCYSFNSKTATVTAISLTLNKEHKKRSGKIKVYATKDLCEKDTTSSLNTSVGSGGIKYTKLATSTNSYGFQQISYNLSNLGRDIGSQSPKHCISYSLAYGAYILSNGQKVSNVFTIDNSFSASQYGAYDTYANSAQDLYNKIIDKLSNNIPVSIHVKPHHWVLVTGFKSNGNTELTNNNITRYLWAIDPYSSKGYSKKGKNVLYDGVIHKEENHRIPSGSTGLKDLRYMSWTNASSAKANRR